MEDVRDQEVVKLIADIARAPLADNRATLSASRVPIRGTENYLDSVRLTPTNPHACHVGLAVLSEAQVNLSLGPPGCTATLEIWEDHRSDALASLRELVTAVVEVATCSASRSAGEGSESGESFTYRRAS